MKIPESIQGPNSKLIYLYVASKDSPVPVTELSDNLNLSKLTILPIIRRLSESGYVKKTDDGVDLED